MSLFPEENNLDKEKCKEFVKNNIPFSELKKMGVFPKEMKFNDYVEITKIILDKFDYKTIEEYVNNSPEMYPDNSFVSGKFPDKVTATGELKIGGDFHLSLAEREFEISCPICECPQWASISTSTWSAIKKCKGCKRKISIVVSKEGRVEVNEK